MPKLDPPIELADPEKNQDHRKFILDVATKIGFCDYTPVGGVIRNGQGMHAFVKTQ